MTLPPMDKKRWADRATRRPYFDALLGAANAASETAQQRELYAQLAFIVALHNDGKVNELDISPVQLQRWAAVLPTLHRAYWGFAPGEKRDRELMRSIASDDLGALASELGDVMDGASPNQLATKLVTEAKKRGLKIDKATALRLVCANEGLPIPPR